MTNSNSLTVGASIVLGCLVLGLTMNTAAVGQGQPASGKYVMTAAGDHGEIRVILCNPVTGECWSKPTYARPSDSWTYMGSPEPKPKAPQINEPKPQEVPAKK